MKKKFLSLLLLGMTVMGAHAQYQFPNSTFDADFISSYGSYTEPEGWHGYATIDASSLNSAGRTGDKLQQFTSVRSGATGKCVGVHSTSIMGVIANGVLTNGQIYTHSTTASDSKNNYNFSDPTNTGNSSTYGANNQFFTPFKGRPDYVKIWVKFAPAKSNTGNARASMILHKAGTIMYDPEDNVTDKSIVIARAAASISAGDWQQLRIPFNYVSSSDPGLILATFTTNETPGGGSANDYLYVDDIEMEYIAEMQNPTYNGSAISFDSNGNATIDAVYSEKLLKYTTGVGATIDKSFDENFLLTITIKGNDISVNPTNKHTYRIQFTGIAGENDDEANVKINTPVLTGSTLTDGRFYLLHANLSSYLNDDNTLTTAPNKYWTVNQSSGSVMDSDNHYFSLDRLSYSSQLNYSNFIVNSNYTSNIGALTFSQSGEIVRMYRSQLKYYNPTVGKKYADIYLGASSATSLVACSSDDANGQWKLISPADYIAYYFCANASGKSTSNGVSYDLSVLNNEAKTTISGLPLGIYTIDNGTKFYLSSGSDLEVTSSNKTLTYYGRLDFSLNATFDGVAISGNSVNKVYNASKLNVNLSGNGQQSYDTFFDEDTYQLTVTIKGYGRSKEYTIQFAEPDLSLNATWYGEKVEDGATINEAYNQSKFVVTPNNGTTVETTYNTTTGVATIIISSSRDSKTYTVKFATIPEAVGESKIYNVAEVYNNGAKLSNPSGSYVFTLATLENNNISFSAYVPSDGTVTAANIPVAKDGSFCYAGYLRTSKTSVLTPATIYGQIKNGELYSAVADIRRDFNGNKYLFHEIFGLASSDSKDYTNDIIVTINGDATTIADQTVTLKNLDNGNISFTLPNFQMSVNGTTQYIGNIFLENLPIDADGNFTFDGGILIGPGADKTITWGGLDLGIVPLNLRGQRYNNAEDVIVVIDIDMQESIGQTIHVTMGAEAQSEVVYTDNMKIVINGDETDVPDTKIVVGKLKNGNINFTLTDFTMDVNGEPSYIGNIAIDNIALDSKGNFTYAGTIRIGKGTDDSKNWGGPELGNVPVVIRGTVCDYAGGNSSDKKTQCAIALDVDMQASLQQTIHVTYGLETVSSKEYADVLAITINGEKSTQNTAITVNTLRNGNINFTLDNFILEDGTSKQYIGSIALENLVLDSEGRFTFDGSIRIGKGSDTSKSWGGPELGDVPLLVNGQLYSIGGTDYLMFNIDIDMEASIQQTINVTFGATPLSSKDYADDLKVTINGEASTQDATITVGTLKNGYINFTLNNFAFIVNGNKQYIGNIAVNALALDEDGNFSYKGNVRIGKGSLAGVTSWGGPDLGAIPMDMKGQIYTVNGQQYLLVSIAIDMQESIGQTIDVLFGGTPINTISITDNLKVSINGQESAQTADVTVGILRNGNINFTLRNFKLQLGEGTSNIGNLSIDNLELDKLGNFTFDGIIRIGNGDDKSVTSWGGPDLGDIPVVLEGKFSEADKKAHVLIDIDMQESLSQIINVEFGSLFGTIADIVDLVKKAQSGAAAIEDINKMHNVILGK